MKCICCNQEKSVAQSHVISDFFRRAITGIDQDNGMKFEFSYVDRRDLPRQNLPKPRLLCTEWDNQFGSAIERPAKSILIPKGDLSQPKSWRSLNIALVEIRLHGDESPLLTAGTYVNLSGFDDFILRKFSVLTAWRALHEMCSQGEERVEAFMASQDGIAMNDTTIDYLKHGTQEHDLFFPYYSELYFVGPRFAAQVSGAVNEVPFAWAIINRGSNFGVAVVMGFWVIVWSLLPDSHHASNFRGLVESTFSDWVPHVSRQLCENRERASQ